MAISNTFRLTRELRISNAFPGSLQSLMERRERDVIIAMEERLCEERWLCPHINIVSSDVIRVKRPMSTSVQACPENKLTEAYFGKKESASRNAFRSPDAIDGEISSMFVSVFESAMRLEGEMLLRGRFAMFIVPLRTKESY